MKNELPKAPDVDRGKYSGTVLARDMCAKWHISIAVFVLNWIDFGFMGNIGYLMATQLKLPCVLNWGGRNKWLRDLVTRFYDKKDFQIPDKAKLFEKKGTKGISYKSPDRTLQQ